MEFYIGLHILTLAKHFERSFISVNILKNRKSDFQVNNWILDSGTFTEISTYGCYRTEVKDYANQIKRWSSCGNMELAVSQDYMCEPFILEKTGLTIGEHQRLTIQRYDELINLTNVPIMPVLQGYQVDDYRRHLDMYGDRISHSMRVGIGSVCKRNKNPQTIIMVLESIKRERSDLRLHGFGLKFTALKDAYIESMLYSADSMACSFHARKNGLNANGIEEAIKFADRISNEKGRKPSQLILCK